MVRKVRHTETASKTVCSLPRKESLDVKDSDEEDDGEGGGEGHGENQENKMTVSPGSITITKSGKVRRDQGGDWL